MRTTKQQYPRVLVVGNDAVGATVADSLPDDVVFRGLDESITRRIAEDVYNSEVVADLNDVSPPEGVKTAIVATDDDSTNLLVTQRLRLLDGMELVVRLNDPAYRQVFADLGVETVCASTQVGTALSETYAVLAGSTE